MHPDHDAAYLVEGIGGSVMPSVCDPGVIDLAERVSDEESFATARRLIREEGLLIGGSSGTAVAAALRVAARVQWSGRGPAGRLVGSVFIPPVAPSGGLIERCVRYRTTRSRCCIGAAKSRALSLEQHFSNLVNAAYGLTPDEVRLMWETAPPRMPIPAPSSKEHPGLVNKKACRPTISWRPVIRRVINHGSFTARVGFPKRFNASWATLVGWLQDDR